MCGSKKNQVLTGRIFSSKESRMKFYFFLTVQHLCSIPAPDALFSADFLIEPEEFLYFRPRLIFYQSTFAYEEKITLAAQLCSDAANPGICPVNQSKKSRFSGLLVGLLEQ
jgi:hypothetical protein